MAGPIRPQVRRVAPTGPSASTRALAAGNTTLRRAVASLRDPTPIRCYAAAHFGGGILFYDSSKTTEATAVGLEKLVVAGAGGFDIFAEAAKYTPKGENAYNNFLDAAAKPRFKFAPRYMGVDFSDAGDDAEDVIQILAEHALLKLQKDGKPVIVQPVKTLPGGLTLDVQNATTVTDKTLRRAKFGDSSPHNLFSFSEGTIFEKEKSLQATLLLSADGINAIKALTGTIPTRGFNIGIVMYGAAELEIDTVR